MIYFCFKINVQLKNSVNDAKNWEIPELFDQKLIIGITKDYFKSELISTKN